MAYKINYPYCGKTYDGMYFIIIEPKYMLTLEHQGTHGFGFASYISRAKILKTFRHSKEITPAQFQQVIADNMINFFRNMPKSETVLQPVQNVKMISYEYTIKDDNEQWKQKLI